MRIFLTAVGRARAGPAASLFDDYAGRIKKLGPGLGIRGFELSEIPESRAASAKDRMAEEARAILDAVGSTRFTVLDERGRDMPSTDLARWLADERDNGASELRFIIGGPDGLADDVRERATRAIAFGRATWPHLLARAMLAEQVYRALTILAGHPYHRE